MGLCNLLVRHAVITSVKYWFVTVNNFLNLIKISLKLRIVDAIRHNLCKIYRVFLKCMHKF
jgi:hypothetical protein